MGLFPDSGFGGGGGEPGPGNVLTVGTVTTLPAEQQASAQITGTSPAQVLNLSIPRGNNGNPGPANTLSIGTVTTVAAGQPATATITGSAPTQTLSLGIPQGFSGITSVRQKSELLFTGLNLTIPTTTTNLIALIKTLTHTGSFVPFFNTATNKLNVFNNNSTVTFKVNLVGTWGGSSTNRSMEVDFPSTTGNKLVESRDAAVTTDIVSLPTFFSVDQGGNLATNGSDITIRSNGGTFIANTILLIAEQMVPTP